MTDRPILFSGEMVRAILDGRKTQTRRLVTLPKRRSLKGEGMEWVKSIHQDGGGNWVAWSTDAPDTAEFTKRAYPNGEGFPCPYGQPGDHLWVRETMWVSECGKYFAVPRYDEGGYPTGYYVLAQDRSGVWRSTSWSNKGRVKKNGKSTGEFSLGWHTANDSYEGAEFRHRRPSIYMPRWASRLTLEVTGVRVERLRRITVIDALAEGVKTMGEFIELWDRINGKRAPYASSPWVWVIGFKRVTA